MNVNTNLLLSDVNFLVKQIVFLDSIHDTLHDILKRRFLFFACYGIQCRRDVFCCQRCDSIAFVEHPGVLDDLLPVAADVVLPSQEMEEIGEPPSVLNDQRLLKSTVKQLSQGTRIDRPHENLCDVEPLSNDAKSII